MPQRHIIRGLKVDWELKAEHKEAAESEVTKALEAVAKMDESLKKDLKKVRDDIKSEIGNVIQKLGVLKLDENVKSDLGILRGMIEELKSKVEVNSNSLVQGELDKLAQEKKTLENVTGSPNGSIHKAMSELESNFKTAIQSPLNEKVDVDSAIGTLGEKFTGLNGEDKKTFEKIFGHIKDKVGEIKGNGGTQKGLDGIVAKVKDLARRFVKGHGDNGFEHRVGGWLEGIIGNGKRPRQDGYKKGLDAVNSWLGQNGGAAVREQVKKKIMEQLTSQIGAAQGKIDELIKNKIDQNKITQNLDGIKQACETFVSGLDEQIKQGAIDGFASAIAGRIEGKPKSTNPNLKSAIEFALVALCASVRQVGNELQSLGIDKFGKLLDAIMPTVDMLNENLKAANQQQLTSSGQKESPAHAVDSRF
ncbi:Extracellular matrix-binding ebh, putative [Babesia ovata]|uniref:Extracellular matrix-binding ebh, putative n=1 Tax=Babesia ovata TaxID=189622 RepID=A0A2H6KEH4_9APIC|nr:Extracellular matrix-binding ebh, putative [Babesia ovata]GBE61387.1 Extracellular matrix-binding ebh, putative [Babesia ovata]